MMTKNRNRSSKFDFANINLLGKCNADCFFCLGKDIEKQLSKHNQLNVHFSEWKNFETFISQCKENEIKKLYLTGQNTDSLMYKYFGELRDYLQDEGFKFGIRTNGYKTLDKLNEIQKCNGTIGISINSLIPEANYSIMRRKDIPQWERIIPFLNDVRIAIVINRYNVHEFFDIVKYVSQFKNIKYVQARRISTDTRMNLLAHDIQVYEDLYNYVKIKYEQTGEFYLAQQFNMFGIEVDFWRTVETSINSINYFTDGTISDEYFVVEGYLKQQKKANQQPTIDQYKLGDGCRMWNLKRVEGIDV